MSASICRSRAPRRTKVTTGLAVPFCALIVAGTASLASSQTAPAALWHFDDGAGTTALDSSGNKINALLVNGPTWTSGKANNAVNLDGINDCISASPNALIDNLSSFSITAWIFPTSVLNGSLGLQIVNKGNKRFSFSDSDSPAGVGTLMVKLPFSGGTTTTYSSAVVPVNQWSHVGLTVDGSADRKAHIYLNGQEVAYYVQPAGSGTLVADVAPNNWFIGSYNGSGTYFKGRIDEVQVFGSALSAAAVLQIYNYIANDTTPPSIPSNLTGAPLSDTQTKISWSAASDNVGVTAYQISRSGAIIGTVAALSFSDSGLSPATAYPYTVAAADAAGNISAQSSPVVVTTLAPPDLIPPSIPGSLTASALSATQIELSWMASTDNVGVAGYQVFRGAALVSTTANNTFIDQGLTQNTSYTYTVKSFDAAGNVSGASSPASMTTLTSPDTTPPSVSIGSPAANANVAGVISVAATASDNVGVVGVQFKVDGVNLGAESLSAPYTATWDTTLSVNGAHTLSAVARDAAGNLGTSSAVTVSVNNGVSSGLGLAGYWSFDNGSGTIAVDSLGGGVNATLVNGPTWKSSGRVNGSVLFDGVDDYVKCAATPALDNLQAFSIQAWVNPTVYIQSSSGLTSGLFSKGANAKRLQFSDTDTVGGTLGQVFGRVAFSSVAATATTLDIVPLKSWALITMTFDPALDAKVHLYINDHEASYLRQVAGAGSITADAATAPPGWILGSLQGTGRFWRGELDEPRIFSRAISLSEIQQYFKSIVNDSTPPTVTVTGPSAGATVSGAAVPVSAVAMDNVGVAGVQFKLNGASLGTERTTPPYTLSWDTTPLVNGVYTLSSVARDALGNAGASSPVDVTVANAADTTPPIISMLSPLDSRTISKVVTAWADASDNLGVVGVQFSIDGQPSGAEVTMAPYSTRLDTTTLADGAHSISARARDAAGNMAVAQVVVTVDNEHPVTPPNIVVILTDDQRYDSMQYMPLLTGLLLNDSVQFSNAYVDPPLCCPSRAGILTGLYSHNTGVLTNKAPWGGATLFNDASTVATWLKQMGYRTGLYGKYLNQCELIASHIPPGWDEWHAFTTSGLAQQYYYNYGMNDNGVMTQYGSGPQDYSGTVVTDKALQFLQSSAVSTQPFFLYLLRLLLTTLPSRPRRTSGPRLAYLLGAPSPTTRPTSAISRRGFETSR
jgi:chitodextrinase